MCHRATNVPVYRAPSRQYRRSDFEYNAGRTSELPASNAQNPTLEYRKRVQRDLHNQLNKGIGRPAVQLLVELCTSALNAYRDDGLTDEQRLDLVMQDMLAVACGKSGVNQLHFYTEHHPWADPKVLKAAKDLKALDACRYQGAKDHDVTPRESFHPDIVDYSTNQILHCVFYLVMGYLTQDYNAVRAGSMLHEARDFGPSLADHKAALLGVQLGKYLRQNIKIGNLTTPFTLEQLPEFLWGAFADPTHPMSKERLRSSVNLPPILHGQALTNQFLKQGELRAHVDWALISLTRVHIFENRFFRPKPLKIPMVLTPPATGAGFRLPQK